MSLNLKTRNQAFIKGVSGLTRLSLKDLQKEHAKIRTPSKIATLTVLQYVHQTDTICQEQIFLASLCITS